MTELRKIDHSSSMETEVEHELAPISNDETLLRQKVVAALRRAIELGTLRAGDRLIEKDLCAKLAVSRTSLREALRDLEANKVVSKISARVLVVTPLAPADAANLYAIRGAIEELITAQFIERADESNLGALRSSFDNLRNCGTSGAVCLDARREFYHAWCKGARNPLAFEMLMALQLRLSVISSAKLRKPELIEQDVAEKNAILGWMASRALNEALEAVREHTRHATEAALTI